MTPDYQFLYWVSIVLFIIAAIAACTHESEP